MLLCIPFGTVCYLWMIFMVDYCVKLMGCGIEADTANGGSSGKPELLLISIGLLIAPDG